MAASNNTCTFSNNTLLSCMAPRFQHLQNRPQFSPQYSIIQTEEREASFPAAMNPRYAQCIPRDHRVQPRSIYRNGWRGDGCQAAGLTSRCALHFVNFARGNNEWLNSFNMMYMHIPRAKLKWLRFAQSTRIQPVIYTDLPCCARFQQCFKIYPCPCHHVERSIVYQKRRESSTRLQRCHTCSTVQAVHNH